MGVMEANILTPFSPPIWIDQISFCSVGSKIFVSKVLSCFIIFEDFFWDQLSLLILGKIFTVNSTRLLCKKRSIINKWMVINLTCTDKTFIFFDFMALAFLILCFLSSKNFSSCLSEMHRFKMSCLKENFVLFWKHV